MIKRIVDVSQPAKINLAKDQLVVESPALGLNSCPIEDLGLLLLSNPTITISHPAMAACATNNVAIVTCDSSHMPVALTLPIAGHHLHAKYLRQQVAVTEPRKKRLWQLIVKQKIREQSSTLEAAGVDPEEINFLIHKVNSGDSTNIEAQAARIYWQRLFGQGFRRLPDAPGINGLLNYGYAVVRAAMARATVAAGLCPALGLHHSNQYNSFALVDDLMEPLRPWIDQSCLGLVESAEPNQPILIDKRVKEGLLGLLITECKYAKKTYPLMVALHYFAADFRECLFYSGSKMQFIVR
jgi:CRISPR-associated protein Cas1